MFETNFSGHKNIWGALPQNSPCGYGPVPILTETVADPAWKLWPLFSLTLNCTSSIGASG